LHIVILVMWAHGTLGYELIENPTALEGNDMYVLFGLLLDDKVIGQVVNLELVIVSASPLVVNVVAKELVNKSELEFTPVCRLLVTTLVTVGLLDKAEFEFNPAPIVVTGVSRSHEAEAKADIILVSIKVTARSNEENRFDIKYYNYNYYKISHFKLFPAIWITGK